MSAIPVNHVLEEVLNPVSDCLTPEVARRIAALRAGKSLQSRLDILADKSTSGTLTEDESAEYHTFVTAINFLGVLQANARSCLRQHGES